LEVKQDYEKITRSVSLVKFETTRKGLGRNIKKVSLAFIIFLHIHSEIQGLHCF